MVHGTRKKCNQTRPSPEKKILATVHCYGAWDFEKFNWHSICTEHKYIFLFLATVLLWCMGLEKNRSHWSITVKNVFLFLTTVILWCTGLTIFLFDTRAENCFGSSYSTRRAWILGKNFIGTLPPPKKNCLYIQYCNGAWDIETIVQYYINV